jgi:hypothetical protein
MADGFIDYWLVAIHSKYLRIICELNHRRFSYERLRQRTLDLNACQLITVDRIVKTA